MWEDQVQTLLGSECDDNETLQPAPWASKIGMPLGPGLVLETVSKETGSVDWVVSRVTQNMGTGMGAGDKNRKKNTWVFPKIGVGPPKSSILIGFFIINHPFWAPPIFGNIHINTKSQKDNVRKPNLDRGLGDMYCMNTLGVAKTL